MLKSSGLVRFVSREDKGRYFLDPAGLRIQGDAKEVFADLFADQVGGTYGVERSHADIPVVPLKVVSFVQPVGATHPE